MAVSLSAAFTMMKTTVTGFSLSAFQDGSLLTLGLDWLDYLILLVGCLVVFFISFLQERGVKIRESLAEKPLCFDGQSTECCLEFDVWVCDDNNRRVYLCTVLNGKQ